MPLVPNKPTIAFAGFLLGCVYIGSVIFFSRLEYESGQMDIADDAAGTGAFRVKGRSFECRRINGMPHKDSGTGTESGGARGPPNETGTIYRHLYLDGHGTNYGGGVEHAGYMVHRESRWALGALQSADESKMLVDGIAQNGH